MKPKKPKRQWSTGKKTRNHPQHWLQLCRNGHNTWIPWRFSFDLALQAAATYLNQDSTIEFILILDGLTPKQDPVSQHFIQADVQREQVPGSKPVTP